MKGIHNIGSNHCAHRVGRSFSDQESADRPGRRCGHFKHKRACMDAATATHTMPLVQQQLKALSPNTSTVANSNTVSKNVTNTSTVADTSTFSHALDTNTSAVQMMILNDLKQTNARLTEQTQFLSRFGAISTAF